MNQFTVTFTEGSATCKSGDYLICQHTLGEWSVYKVEDVLLIKRLLPVEDDPSTLLVEEHLLDSMIPTYFGEVHLLLTVFYSDYSVESEIFNAIEYQTLEIKTRGLLRAGREFSKSNCRVISQ